MGTSRKDIAPTHMRCAIYTRKSTSNRLDLEINSLQTQRDVSGEFRLPAWLLPLAAQLCAIPCSSLSRGESQSGLSLEIV